MSRDGMTDLGELDDLSRRLEAAGRRAEHALHRDPVREREIVGRIRAQLIGEAVEQEDAEHDHRLVALRPIVRTGLPGVRPCRLHLLRARPGHTTAMSELAMSR